MNVRKMTAGLLLIIALGAGGFFAGRLLVSDEGTEAEEPNLIERLDAVKTLEAQQRTEPRFTGELLGIDIAPSIDELPEIVRDQRQRELASGCDAISVEEAAELDFPRMIVLPDDFVVADQDSANAGSNPWAFVCGATVTSLGWDYVTSPGRETPGDVTIVRRAVGYAVADVPISNISVDEVGGRSAIVIRPGTVDGLAQRSRVIFPEVFGVTEVRAFNLSFDELFAVAVSVAEASR